jgi:hypothetical protein
LIRIGKKVITQNFEHAPGAGQTNYRWSLGENTGGYSLASGTRALTQDARCLLIIFSSIPPYALTYLGIGGAGRGRKELWPIFHCSLSFHEYRVLFPAIRCLALSALEVELCSGQLKIFCKFFILITRQLVLDG